MRYCGQCGARLSGPGAGNDEGARVHLSVLFCDIVDSTALADRLDPEVYREVVQAYQRACDTAIRRFEGFTAAYLGDGVLVYFGWPRGHEDHARRAVHTGLRIVEAVRDLNPALEQAWGVRLSVRIGIDTGRVVAAEFGGANRRDVVALGSTPNVAARLQGLAAPDTVVVSRAVHDLVSGFFEFESLGAHELKGIAAPVDVFRALGETRVRDSFELAMAKGLTPAVGRSRELARFRGLMAEVLSGRPQVVGVVGDPGIGKSRLVRAFAEATLDLDLCWTVARCSPYHGASPFHPFVDLLHREIVFEPDDDDVSKLARIGATLDQLGSDDPDALLLAADLLGVPLPEGLAPLELAPERMRRKTQDLIVDFLLRRAKQGPAAVVVEDLHWADPSSLDLLGVLASRARGTAVVLVLTSRPTRSLPWEGLEGVWEIQLGSLNPSQARLIVRNLLGGRSLPAEVLAQVVERTDGVPLFVEELTKAVLDSGALREVEGVFELTRPVGTMEIPVTLRGSLEARLDHLGEARRVAQMAAVIGREFSEEMLGAVSGLEPEELDSALQALVASGLVQRGREDGVFHFSHALVQEAAAATLLTSARRAHHRAIAETLGCGTPDRLQSTPEIVAYHLTEAGEPDLAVRHWIAAAQHALDRSATSEAIEHASRGLALVGQLSDDSARSQAELALRIVLGGAWTVAKGYAATEVEQAFSRAAELCETVGDLETLIRARVGLYGFFVVQARHAEAQEIAEALLRTAMPVEARPYEAGARFAMGFSNLHRGEPKEALLHFDRGCSMELEGAAVSPVSTQVASTDVTCRSYRAFALWLVGHPDDALASVQDAVERTVGRHAYSEVYARVAKIWVHWFRGETEDRAREVQLVTALAGRKGFSYMLQLAEFQRCLQAFDARLREGADAGELETAARRMEAVLDRLGAIGARIGEPLMRGALADARLRAGHVDEADEELAQAVAAAEQTGESYWLPELERLSGLAAAARPGGTLAAESHYRQAWEHARAQGAASLALRAATSLAASLLARGVPVEAEALLAEARAAIRGGETTADLRRADVLLSELRRERSSFTRMPAKR